MSRQQLFLHAALKSPNMLQPGSAAAVLQDPEMLHIYYN